MPVSKANPPQVSPSSVSIGKKPMNYSANHQVANQQQQPKSARAAAKAPAYNTQQQQQQQQQQQNHQSSPPSFNTGTANKARSAVGGNSGTNGSTAPQKGKANASKIWSTSTTEERERIKEFWLGLGELERRNLVKVEKDTVLRKMKEQQKHSCSCAVCGRKRNAIEEELEVLYDAYYEELEQYANYQQRYLNSGGAIPPPPGPGPFPGSVELDKDGAVVAPTSVTTTKRIARAKQQLQGAIQQNGRKQQQRTRTHPQHHPPGKESEFDDDGEEDDEYEADEYEEEEEEDELEGEEEEEDEEDELHPQRRLPNGRDVKPTSRQTAGRKNPPGRGGGGRDGLFNIENSLTVTGPGNILTVADDLLKNDGQKFLEMMEQLAERRLQREEEAAADVEDESDDDLDEDRDGSEGDDDGNDDDASDDDEEEEEDEEEEIMTEEQKMEEGKRMFSIFAARMFEQRVLQAYREKVAQERQLQLLRELDEEDKTSRDREAKKQSQNQKKKDKKKQQKMAKDEERAAKDAEKAAEEARAKARQTAIDEENRRKREDERQRREAAKRAADEEKARKDEEKRKRHQEERERELEREKKKRDKEEREKKEREDKERKAKEERARLAKEREEKAEKERIEKEKKEGKERLEREEKLKKEKEEKAEREAKEKDRVAAQKAVAAINVARTPVRVNMASSSSSSSSSTPTKQNLPPTPPALQRTPNSSGSSAVNGIPPFRKAGNSKQGPSPTPSVPPGVVGQTSRSHPQQSQGIQPLQQLPNLSRTPLVSSAPANAQQIPPHLPPQQPGMVYGHLSQGSVLMPPAPSPRVGTFPSMHYPYGNPNMQHPPGSPLTPSTLSQGFNGGPSFDSTFNRSMTMPSIGVSITRGSVGLPPSSNPPTPIGPPKTKTPLTATSTPGPSMLAPGAGRRGSAILNASVLNDSPAASPVIGVGLGPITRPMAPIARPTTAANEGTTSSGSGSPNRRSPSPKGTLGSSALAADDDGVVQTVSPRRVGSKAPIGIGLSLGTPLQSWGPASPRSALSPWGASNFPPSSARVHPTSSIGGGSSSAMHIPIGAPQNGPPSSVGAESMWANTPASATSFNDAWHLQNAGPFFHGPNQFLNHHNVAASSAPHTGS